MSGNPSSTKLFGSYLNTELIALFQRINEEIRFLDNYVSLDILPVSKLIRLYHLQAKELAASETDLGTQSILTSCVINIQEAVTSLQIHDAISQKLDHMYQLHQRLIEELESWKQGSSLEETACLAVLIEILAMNKAQLLLIQKEYCQAVKTIQTNLSDTERKLKNLSASSGKLPQFFFHYEQFDKVVDHLVQRLQQLVNTLSPTFPTSPHRIGKLERISSLFTMESERLVLHQTIFGEATEVPDNNYDTDQTELF